MALNHSDGAPSTAKILISGGFGVGKTTLIGAIGAVVLADTQRVADCFASIDYFEHHGMPFIVAINCFDSAPRFQPDDIRIALSLGPGVPIVLCDARDRDSVKHVLVSLVRHVMSRSRPDSGPRRASLGTNVPGGKI